MSEIKKKKRKLNGKFLALVAGSLLIILSIFKVPNFINTNKILSLGYSEEALKAINQKGLRRTILKNEYYSDYLNEEIVKEDFNIKYLRLYLITDYLDQEYFDYYELLKEKKNYNDEELEALYSSLRIYDLKPLLIYDKLENLDDYINDCLKNNNDANHFNVNGDYLHPYENIIEVSEPDNEEAFVSLKHYLGDYKPEKLVPIRQENAIANIYIDTKALDDFNQMCSDIRLEEGTYPFYAIEGFVSYDTQKLYYEQNPNNTKAGYCDAQTGLTVRVKTDEGISFKDSNTYKWLLNNSYKYGFIQRFPEGKEALTGHSAEYNYFRYVGKDLANKIHQSGLCFDEYYYLYMN